MSDLNLENIVGFKAVDKNGNERQVTVDEMTELVSARIVSAASEISTFAAAAAAGTDEFEDQLPQSDTFSWLRTLDGSKNPTLTSSSAAAKVLGGLIGIEKIKKTVTATLEGSIIYLGDIGYNSYIVSCNDGGMPFNLIIISNSGNINYNIINGMIRRGYSINVDGDKKQYLKIKRDETVIDKDFNFTFFRVI